MTKISPQNSEISLQKPNSENQAVRDEENVQDEAKLNPNEPNNNNDDKNNNNEQNDDKKENKKCDWKAFLSKHGIRLAVFLALAILILILFLYSDDILNEYYDFIPWFEDNLFLGILLYWVFYTIAGIFMFPNTIFGLAAGYMFYQVFDENLALTLTLGSLITQVGTTLAANAAFILGRYVFTDLVRKIAQKYKKFMAVQKALKHKGKKFVLLCRLAPVNPDNVFNYLCGGTDLSFIDYLFGCIGLYPGSFVLTYFGTLIKNLEEIISGDYTKEDRYTYALIIAGSFGIIMVIIILILAKREITKILKEEEEKEKQLKQEQEEQDKNNNKNNNNDDNENTDDVNKNKDNNCKMQDSIDNQKLPLESVQIQN